jgi:hypothetical protein
MFWDSPNSSYDANAFSSGTQWISGVLSVLLVAALVVGVFTA